MSVRNAILGLLSQHPRHGYELRRAFEALVGGEATWDVKPAQIYTTLSRLEEAGYVRQAEPQGETVAAEGGSTMANPPDKRIYELTPQGRAELAAWFSTGVEGEHQRDEFYIKLMLSLDGEVVSPYQVIHAQRSRLYQDLHDLTARRNTTDPRSELAQIFLLDKAIMHIEADLRWLDMIESRLDEIRRQPVPEVELRPRGRPRKNS